MAHRLADAAAGRLVLADDNERARGADIRQVAGRGVCLIFATLANRFRTAQAGTRYRQLFAISFTDFTPTLPTM